MTQSTIAATLKEGFSKDFLASIVVFLVALPLCLGIAIASGMPPTAGIVTGIVGGIIVGSLAGAPLTVSGPAAGLVVLVAEILAAYGAAMMAVILLLAGILQMIAGALKLGVWFRAISPAVIHGMLAGIGILIIGSQFHIMLDRTPLANGIQNLMDIPNALFETLAHHGGNLSAAFVGILTIGTIILWTRFAPQRLKMIPGALVGVLLAILAANLLNLDVKFLAEMFDEPATLSNLFDFSIPSIDHIADSLNGGVILAIVSLAFIASTESLLSVTAVDKMHQGPRAKYDKELFAQGIGNSICGMLGALPMTGVIVRSSANVQAGAVSRKSTIMHGTWLLIFVGFFLFTLHYIPVATLAAVLVYTGYKLAYPKVAKELLAYGKAELAIYIITLVTIVSFDLLTGVVTGLALSLLKLIYIFAHVVIKTDKHPSENEVTMHLKGSATFVGLPKLATALEEIEPGKTVNVQFDDLEYIDHACIELLDNWQKQYVMTGGNAHIHWDSLMSKYHQQNNRS